MTENTNMTGAEFAQGLETLGWSQVEFGRRTDTSPSTVNRWIGGYLPVPGWAAAHLRVLLGAKQFHDAHIAPTPRTRRKSADDQEEGGAA